MAPLKSKPARHQLICEILAKESVKTQDELRERLAQGGVKVTQATLSRDLDELGAVKVVVRGETIYAIRESGDVTSVWDIDSTARLSRVAREVVTAVRPAQNLVVVQTRPGAAHYFASAVDRDAWPQVVGSVAGDDTVLVVVIDSAQAQIVADTFASLAQTRSKKHLEGNND